MLKLPSALGTRPSKYDEEPIQVKNYVPVQLVKSGNY